MSWVTFSTFMHVHSLLLLLNLTLYILFLALVYRYMWGWLHLGIHLSLNLLHWDRRELFLQKFVSHSNWILCLQKVFLPHGWVNDRAWLGTWGHFYLTFTAGIVSRMVLLVPFIIVYQNLYGWIWFEDLSIKLYWLRSLFVPISSFLISV
jgi:hypothetical protein